MGSESYNHLSIQEMWVLRVVDTPDPPRMEYLLTFGLKSKLTNMFQMDWNHQLEDVSKSTQVFFGYYHYIHYPP